ncbi:hypothetical protein B0H13DRAFT_2481231 [Mycena leptocephala]|nr:hypothetical protein B0H13DRAFT_2481231 [Mycena leptocephala]
MNRENEPQSQQLKPLMDVRGEDPHRAEVLLAHLSKLFEAERKALYKEGEELRRDVKALLCDNSQVNVEEEVTSTPRAILRFDPSNDIVGIGTTGEFLIKRRGREQESTLNKAARSFTDSNLTCLRQNSSRSCTSDPLGLPLCGGVLAGPGRRAVSATSGIVPPIAATVGSQKIDKYPGQSNYASACTILEGILARYRNAFSLIVPGILDAGYSDRTNSQLVDNKNIFAAASMSTAQLWTCLQDGLQKIKEGSAPFTRYIPDLDWGSILLSAAGVQRRRPSLIKERRRGS